MARFCARRTFFCKLAVTTWLLVKCKNVCSAAGASPATADRVMLTSGEYSVNNERHIQKAISNLAAHSCLLFTACSEASSRFDFMA
eukprot:6567921-Pyramimonas_sp.AAC.1